MISICLQPDLLALHVYRSLQIYPADSANSHLAPYAAFGLNWTEEPPRSSVRLKPIDHMRQTSHEDAAQNRNCIATLGTVRYLHHV